jgi:antirestriction protein
METEQIKIPEPLYSNNPSVFVACTASLNNGVLHGVWIDLIEDDPDEMIEELFEESEFDEWKILETRNLPTEAINFHLEKLVEVAKLIEEHGDAFQAYLAITSMWDVTEEDFEEKYCGEYDSEEDYAEELFDELYAHDIPENLRFYIDYEKFARDLFISDYTFEDGYVFRKL